MANEVRLDGETASRPTWSTSLKAKWAITDNLNFEAILSTWEQVQRQVVDFDGTEFLITTDDIPPRAREPNDRAASVRQRVR